MRRRHFGGVPLRGHLPSGARMPNPRTHCRVTKPESRSSLTMNRIRPVIFPHFAVERLPPIPRPVVQKMSRLLGLPPIDERRDWAQENSDPRWLPVFMSAYVYGCELDEERRAMLRLVLGSYARRFDPGGPGHFDELWSQIRGLILPFHTLHKPTIEFLAEPRNPDPQTTRPVAARIAAIPVSRITPLTAPIQKSQNQCPANSTPCLRRKGWKPRHFWVCSNCCGEMRRARKEIQYCGGDSSADPP